MQKSSEEFAQREGERTGIAKPPRFDPDFRARLYDLLRRRRDVRGEIESRVGEGAGGSGRRVQFPARALPEGTVQRLVGV